MLWFIWNNVRASSPFFRRTHVALGLLFFFIVPSWMIILVSRYKLKICNALSFSFFRVCFFFRQTFCHNFSFGKCVSFSVYTFLTFSLLPFSLLRVTIAFGLCCCTRLSVSPFSSASHAYPLYTLSNDLFCMALSLRLAGSDCTSSRAGTNGAACLVVPRMAGIDWGARRRVLIYFLLRCAKALILSTISHLVHLRCAWTRYFPFRPACFRLILARLIFVYGSIEFFLFCPVVWESRSIWYLSQNAALYKINVPCALGPVLAGVSPIPSPRVGFSLRVFFVWRYGYIFAFLFLFPCFPFPVSCLLFLSLLAYYLHFYFFPIVIFVLLFSHLPVRGGLSSSVFCSFYLWIYFRVFVFREPFFVSCFLFSFFWLAFLFHRLVSFLYCCSVSANHARWILGAIVTRPAGFVFCTQGSAVKSEVWCFDMAYTACLL